MTVIKLIPSGMYEVCALVNGEYHRRRYGDCTKQEAIRWFREEIKEIQATYIVERKS